MAQFGSGRSIIAQNQSAVADSNGNLIVSPDDSFGASPLGVAARTQALYGIPNANFNILPADPYTAISSGNVLPYWDTVVSGEGTATMQYDTTTQSWAVQLDPTACATAGETITMRARTYLLNDSNLTLRQKAFASITKVGTQATSEWDLVLSATYYSEAGAQLSTYNIGTANSGTTWTTINGFTTSGTAAIDPAAHYADLALTLTTSGSVAGTAVVDINSLLLQTSTGSGGSQSFLLTQTFTSSGTFTVPTGVNYVTVVAVGAGQGGGGGGNTTSRNVAGSSRGAAGGATGYYALVRDIYVGGTSSVSVGIGAGGVGGTALTLTKPAGSATPTRTDTDGSTGASGGDTTFGTFLTVPGARTAPSGFLGITVAAGASGGAGGQTGSAVGTIGGTAVIGSTNTGAPFINFWAGGVAGGTATGSGGSGGANGNGGIAGTALGIAGGGGGGGAGTANPIGLTAAAGAGGVGGPGGGASGGGAVARWSTVTTTLVATAGAGGSAAANTGGGGGGGGACAVLFSGTASYNPSTVTTTSGAGGAGGSGVLYVIYVA
jgi:hypothetical protein